LNQITGDLGKRNTRIMAMQNDNLPEGGSAGNAPGPESVGGGRSVIRDPRAWTTLAAVVLIGGVFVWNGMRPPVFAMPHKHAGKTGTPRKVDAERMALLEATNGHVDLVRRLGDGPGGLTELLVRHDGKPAIMWALPDDTGFIPGAVYSPDGANLTREATQAYLVEYAKSLKNNQQHAGPDTELGKAVKHFVPPYGIPGASKNK